MSKERYWDKLVEMIIEIRESNYPGKPPWYQSDVIYLFNTKNVGKEYRKFEIEILDRKLKELNIKIEIQDNGEIKRIDNKIIKKLGEKGNKYFLITNKEGRAEETFIDSGCCIIKNNFGINDFGKILSHGLGHLLGYVIHCTDYIKNHRNRDIMCTPYSYGPYSTTEFCPTTKRGIKYIYRKLKSI